ncbi:MAG: primosomal protein N' [Armatimonadota bacterium]
MKYAQVIVDLKLKSVDKPFTYQIPPDLKDKLDVGSIVYVPFGRSKYKGYCIGFTDEEVKGIKPIEKLLEQDYYFSPEFIKLASWMCRYYNCLWSEALSCIVPKIVADNFEKDKEEYFLKYNFEAGEDIEKISKRSPKKHKILDYIKEQNRWVSFDEIQSSFKATISFIKDMVNKEYLLLNVRKRSIYDNGKGYSEDFKPRLSDLKLNKDQEESLSALKELLLEDKAHTFLLHGVTASGKTEVYMRLMEECILKGRQAMILVPEISLTPQNIRLFKHRFGDFVAVLHSALDDKERLNQWIKIATNKVKIVLGARSAVFAPVHDLGLIIIDEEHETSYKQENSPRYNAKEVAARRSEYNNALLVLGSATPSVESFYNAKEGAYKYYYLPNRVEGRTLPDILTVDLKDKSQAGYNRILSTRLKNEVSYSLLNKEQIIIFLNRRGFNTFVLCSECGHIYKCRNCNVSLTYHKQINKLICHHCFFRQAGPSVCAKCGGSKFKFCGTGTQKIEDELKELYPQAVILRMDRDTTQTKGAHEKILDRFLSREGDILLGTQMITKGLDFPDVALVGVALADIGLNMPDFRAGERTFQLLTQVAGRSGRGSKKGKVIIQTYTPDNFSIKTALKQDYFEFYNQEIKARRDANYPPFSRLVNCIISGVNEQDVTELIEKFSGDIKKEADLLKKSNNSALFDILGPAPCPIVRIKNRFRWHLLIKCDNIIFANEVINKLKDKYKIKKDIRFIVDADPVSLL